MRDQFTDDGIVVDKAIGFWIHRVYQASRNEMFRAFREAGEEITPEQLAVLIRLWEQDGRTQTALAEDTLRDKPTMSRILEGMEARNIIERRTDPNDARVRIVKLTRRGRDLQKKLVPVARGLVSQMVASIEPKALEITRDALRQMFENMTR